MYISFKDVLPAPLQSFSHAEESVWKKGFEIHFPVSVLLNATSGKGKSTFVQLLNGLRNDYTGTITFDQKSIDTLSLDEWILLRKEKIGTIFQDLQLFPSLTTWENLIVKNELTHHRSESEILQFLERLGLLSYKDQVSETLSFGQQQRVAIIRALLQPFELLLMDEPFSHLDKGNTELAMQLILAEVERNNAGFILTSLGEDYGVNYDFELKL